MVTKRQLNCIPRFASGFKRREPVITPMFPSPWSEPSLVEE
jgi:hypothetical protein